ncbi:Glutamyl-Q tRNA(Asp) synthetase [hydrothermal vent metagenome]|uniref:Glutamyl-Q tRNA(Asp) synthetase n=1 Tax=hydrothermal vent metagenome TaxID=652676 RepID=A0A3B0Y109_9ZZZZ
MAQIYRGRFAPSPTGPLHKGSLVAAIASYLEARKHNGQWLVRMEDVDERRNVDGAADCILRSLEAYGFEWDEDILYQSHRKQAYSQALDTLRHQGLIYPCTCSRKSLRAKAAQGEILTGQLGYIYPGLCSDNHFSDFKPADYAVRIKVPEENFGFTDELLKHHSTQNLKHDLGDFIIRRRDGLFAYQLAVVVDDAYQNITHVVRGVDLLDSTPRQLYLQQCLNYPRPAYAHLPLILCENGDKLSKQTGAQDIGDKADSALMVACLDFLGQKPPSGLEKDTLANVWQWAGENWNLI